MRVFAAFKPRDVTLVGPWAASWRSRGWTPRLVLLEGRESLRGAVLEAGGGYLADLRLFNRGFRSPRRKHGRLCRRATEKMPGLVRLRRGQGRADLHSYGLI